jgi:hypothetical protein
MVQPKYNPQEALERVKLMMNYDLSKTSVENKKVIEEQAQPNSDPFACVKNYALLKRVEISTPKKGGNYIWATFVDTSGNVTDWFFEIRNGNNEWSEMVNGKFKPVSDKTGYGKWECDGNKNFKITKNDGSIYKSSDVNTSQTVQPVAQPKADNKQGTPDPSKPQKLKPKDSPLGTTLKDTSIPKRSCVVFIDQFYSQYQNCPEGINTKSPACKKEKEIIQQREYVQRCMNEYFPSGSRQGNWGITGLGGSETDQKLLKLSACPMKFVGRPNPDIVDAPHPSQSGTESIFRLTRKC